MATQVTLPCLGNPPCYDARAEALFVIICIGEAKIIASSMDSDLEAFSRNPTHGSFAALAGQLTAKTNYASKLFLSY